MHTNYKLQYIICKHLYIVNCVQLRNICNHTILQVYDFIQVKIHIMHTHTHTHTPVSYTHLDVYKRQTIHIMRIFVRMYIYPMLCTE